MARKNNRWTPQQDEMVREQYEAMGAKRLAEEMGLTVDAVLHRAKLLGIKYRKFIWSEEKLAVLEKRYATDGPQKLAEEFGTTHWAVTAKARRLGIGSTRKTPPKDFEWTDEMVAAIQERYVAEAAYKLADEFGVALDTVRRKASSLGLHTIAGHATAGQERAEKSESSDIHYFDEWSPNMAYILGFIFADGSLDATARVLTINLANPDVAVLHFVAECLAVKSEIRHTHYSYQLQPQVSINVCSSVLCQRLRELGCHPRKTFNNDPFPSIPDGMLPHFIRGYFDGDGSACLAHDKRSCCDFFIINITGSPRLITGIHDSLVRVAGMSAKTIQQKKGITADYCVVAWTALRDLKAFYSFVYPTGFTFCLERKRQKIAEWLAKPHREIVHQSWNEEEEQLVRDYYRSLGPTRLAAMLGRKKAAVSLKAQRLGLEPLNKRRM